MTTRIRQWLSAALAGVGLSASGCMTTAPYTESKAAYSVVNENRIVIDRDTLSVHSAQTVLDLLETRVARFRFSSNALGKAPLIVVDDVLLVEGVSVLSSMRATDVQRVSILWPTDAAFRYGSAGSNGAIVVTTKRGRMPAI